MAALPPAANSVLHPVVSYPVQVIAQQKEALAGAVLLASKSPAKGHVHRIRTTTRRMEAQMELLPALEAVSPGYGKAARRLGKLLKEVRKAGGAVRDLDVQRSLLEDLAGNDSTRKDAEQLDRLLKRKREKAADALAGTLADIEKKLVRSLDDLAAALESQDGLSLPAAEAEERIRSWYRARVGDAEARRSTEELHEARKAAKLARYMGEANGSEALAGQFGALQEAGGSWHDLLLLAGVARKRLGKGSSLSRLLTERRDAARRAYREQLRRFAA